MFGRNVGEEHSDLASVSSSDAGIRLASTSLCVEFASYPLFALASSE